jgi:TolB-like protein/Tfp pilus assembly protein PilF
MLTQKSQVKIMDFGLAKFAGKTKLTKTDMTLGTVAYMSPEQAQGSKVDCRSDIFSLGVVLYEMLTGQTPFKGDYELAVVYSILHEAPEPITGLRTGVPMELERIVDKTMTKSPDERYQHVDELIVDLGRLKKELKSEVIRPEVPRKHFKSYVVPGILLFVAIFMVAGYFFFDQILQKRKPETETIDATKWKNSIAVLPFVDLSAQKDQEYFCDGMTDDIIMKVSQVKGLKVSSMTSVMSYKNTDKDIRKIGQELGVSTILEGSISKDKDDIRVRTRLIKVENDFNIWSDYYDRKLESVFAIQDEISLAIVEKLRVEILGEERTRLVKRYTEDLEAYNFYLKGRYFYNKRTEKGLKSSVESFKRAIEIDPEFALAYAGLADTYLTFGLYEFLPMKEAYKRANKEALKALEMDDTVGELHASIGNIKAWYEFDWEGAEWEYKRALELNPSDGEAHHMYAHLLEGLGRFNESFGVMRRALELEPLSINLNMCRGHILFMARKYDEAIVQIKKTTEMDPSFPLLYYWLGRAYLEKGMLEQAVEMFEKATTFPMIRTMATGALGYAYAISGEKDKAQKRLDQLNTLSKEKYVDPYYISLIYLGLGEKDRVFEFSEKAYEGRSMYISSLKVDPFYDDLRSDPRFVELLMKMRLDN